jgi:cysteine desulfuration protein SufE
LIELMDLDELRDNFELLDGWEERYRYLIDLGKKLPPMDDALKNEVTKVDGCMSQVWMSSHLDDGRIRFVADSDAAIVRGLIALLMVAYDDETPEHVTALDIGPFFDALGLAQHVSMNRRNGFFAMVERIQRDARALTSRQASRL